MYSHDSSPKSAYCAATTLPTACARGSPSESSPLALRRANSSRMILMMARSRSSFSSSSVSAGMAWARSSKRITLPLSPIAVLSLALLYSLLEALQALYQLLLFAGFHSGAQDLRGTCFAQHEIHLAKEHLLSDLRSAKDVHASVPES